jgi:hypothetical protein
MLDRISIAAVALAALTMTITPAGAHDESKYPDWAGQWNRVPDGGPPRYDPSKPIRKQDAPLKPEYQAMWETSLKDIDAGGFGLDRHYSCLPTGMPRQMSGVSRFEFVFGQDLTYMIFEDNTLAPRRIYTDGAKRATPKEPTFVGTSTGVWRDTDGDGRYDTLEIETRNVRGPRTWDQTGLPMADDNEAVFRERISLDKTNPDILHDELTTTDNSLTRPWTVTKNFRRVRKDVTWEENNCVEGNAYITIDGEVYVVSGDGPLMPSKKGQSPPDLKYFKPSKK